jgi:hypothetical protein
VTVTPRSSALKWCSAFLNISLVACSIVDVAAPGSACGSWLVGSHRRHCGLGKCLSLPWQGSTVLLVTMHRCIDPMARWQECVMCTALPLLTGHQITFPTGVNPRGTYAYAAHVASVQQHDTCAVVCQ